MMRADNLAVVLALVIGAVAAVNGIAAAASARASSPHRYASAAALTSLVPPGAKVCIEGGRGLEGPPAGAAAYFLRHTDLYGELRTGYSTFFRPWPDGPASELCAWFLLPANSPPPPVVTLPSAEWEGNGWRLYQRDPAVLAALDLRELVASPRARRSAGPGSSAAQPITGWRSDGAPDIASWTPPLLGVLAPTTGVQWRASLLARGITFQVQGDSLSVRYGEPAPADAAPTEQGSRSLDVVVATTAGPAIVSAGGRTPDATAVLAPGVAVISIGGVSDTARVELAQRSGSAHAVAAYLVARATPTLAVTPVPGLFSVTIDGDFKGNDAALSLNGPLTGTEAVLDIYREDGGVHYGYWRLGTEQLPGPLTLDVAAQRLSVWSGAILASETFPITDGRYRAYLARYRNGVLKRMLPLFSFRLRAGHATEFVMETRGDHLW